MPGALIRTSAGVPRFGYDPANRPTSVGNLLTPAEIAAGEYDWPGAGADVAAVFGALTQAGQGGVAVTGASISSGDPSGHWAIASGRIAPSVGGVGNLAGPYNLTLNNGETVAITIEANRRDVRTDAELSSAISAVDGGTIHLRAGTYTTRAFNSLTKTSETVIQSDPIAEKTFTWGYGEEETIGGSRSGAALLNNGIDISGSSNLHFKHLNIRRAPGTDYIVATNAGANLWFSNCEIHSDQPATYNYTGGSALPVAFGRASSSVGTGTSGVRINDCLIHTVIRGIEYVAVGSGHQIQRNAIRDCYTMFLQMRTEGGAAAPNNVCDGMIVHGNFCLGIWLTDADTTTYGIHSAMFALQGDSDIRNWSIEGNVMAPVYDNARPGGIDLDGDTDGNMHNRNVILRGNIVLCTQHTGDCSFYNAEGGCHHFGNSYLTHVSSNQSRTTNFQGCMAVYKTTAATTYGSNYCQHNVVNVEGTHNRGHFGACVRYASTYYLDSPPAAVTASNNLGTGMGGLYSSVNGVIDSWPTSTAAGSVGNTSVGARYIDMYTGSNAAGDFCNVTNPHEVFRHTDAHKAALGTWVGAVQESDSYVTFAPGHKSNPQTVTFDAARQPW